MDLCRSAGTRDVGNKQRIEACFGTRFSLLSLRDFDR